MDGVLNAVSGYAGGSYEKPTYKSVLAHRYDKSGKNYAEAVKVTYDNSKVDAKTLIKSFWEMHDPTQVNGQGNDIGNNYRSAIYYTNEKQKNVAFTTEEQYQKLLNAHGYGKITTEIKPLKKFYPAEGYHQDYLQKNPNGYCPNHATNVKFAKEKTQLNAVMPLGGKEVAHHVGFMNEKEFYKMLGDFKHTPEGVFVPKK